MTTDRERAIRRAQLRAVIADEGEDPDRYEIVFDDEETLEEYHFRRLSPAEVHLRRRESLAVAEEFLIKALRQFGYGSGALEEMDVVEMAEIFRDEMNELHADTDDQPGGGDTR